MIVVDTNVIAYLFLPGSRTADAEKLLTADPVWAVPLLWRSEFRNVLAGYLRRGDLTHAQANELLSVAETMLKTHEYLVPGNDVLDLVNRSDCSAYDCEFVALAKAHAVPLVTENARVRRALPRVARSIAEFLRG